MEKNYEDWTADARKLHELAQELLAQTPTIEVRISRPLAEEAVAAWQREEEPGELPQETDKQSTVRGDAATLALIGHVIFKLDAWILGNALEAADRAGRIELFPPPVE